MGNPKVKIYDYEWDDVDPHLVWASVDRSGMPCYWQTEPVFSEYHEFWARQEFTETRWDYLKTLVLPEGMKPGDTLRKRPGLLRPDSFEF